MKNQLFTLAAVLTASAALTSCSNELQVENELVQEGISELKSYTVVIHATKPDNDALTRAISEEGGGALSTSWAANEKVYAYKADTGTPVDVTLTADDIDPTNSKKATLKFNFGGATFAENDQIVLYYQKVKEDYGDYSGQVGTLDDIAANFDRMKATVRVQAVNPSHEILSTTPAVFVRQQAITKFTVKKKADDSDLAIDPLSIKVGALEPLSIDPASAKNEIWVALPGRASSASADEKTYKFETTADGKQYGVSKSVDLVNNKYYTATLTMGRDIQKITVTGLPAGSPATQGYTGAAVNVTGATSSESEAMTSSTDYTVTYQKNTGTPESPVWETCNAADVKNAGQYKAVITGAGEYEGTEEKIFSITKISEADVISALTAGTIDNNSEISQGTNTPIVPSTAFGLTGAQIKAGAEVDINNPSVKSSITIGTKTPDTDWASINNAGELVTTGGGIVTVTISLPETANHAAGSVTKTIYVKQSGIGGELPDPGNGTW